MSSLVNAVFGRKVKEVPATTKQLKMNIIPNKTEISEEPDDGYDNDGFIPTFYLPYKLSISCEMDGALMKYLAITQGKEAVANSKEDIALCHSYREAIITILQQQYHHLKQNDFKYHQYQHHQSHKHNIRTEGDVINVFTEYCKILTAIEARFPLNVSHATTNSIQYLNEIKFVWTNTCIKISDEHYEKLEKLQLNKLADVIHHDNTINFERSSVLLNLCALLNNMAVVNDKDQLHTVEGLTNSVQRLRVSVGILEYLSQNFRIVNGNGEDTVSASGAVAARNQRTRVSDAQVLMKFLHLIGLAQLQCLSINLLMLKRHDLKEIAQVSLQASLYFKELYDMSSNEVLVDIFSQKYPSYLKFFELHYSYRAQYEYSLGLHIIAEENGDGYGEEIARLQKAHGLCRVANSYANSHNLVINLSNQYKKLEARWAAAIKHNEDITKDRVPQQHELKDIVPRCYYEPIVIDESMVIPRIHFDDDASSGAGNKNPYFSKILPESLFRFKEDFQTKTKEVTAQINKSVDAFLEETSKKLESHGFPDVIVSDNDEIRSRVKKIWNQIVDKVHSVGGANVVGPEALSELKKRNEGEIKRLEGILNIINDYVQKDNEFFQRYAGTGLTETLIPLSRKLKDLKAKTEEFIQKANAARQLDIVLENRAIQFNQGLAFLSKSESEIMNSFIAGNKGTVANPNSAAILALQDQLLTMLADFNTKKAELEQKRNALVQKFINLNIIKVIILQKDYESRLANKTKREEMLNTFTKSLNEKLDEMSNSISLLLIDVNNMIEKKDQLKKARAQTPSQNKLEANFQTVDKYLEEFVYIYQKSAKGKEFYKNLGALITQINDEAYDIITKRVFDQDEINKKAKSGASPPPPLMTTTATTQTPPQSPTYSPPLPPRNTSSLVPPSSPIVSSSIGKPPSVLTAAATAGTNSPKPNLPARPSLQSFSSSSSASSNEVINEPNSKNKIKPPPGAFRLPDPVTSKVSIPVSAVSKVALPPRPKPKDLTQNNNN